jgi:hypothetical protein
VRSFKSIACIVQECEVACMESKPLPDSENAYEAFNDMAFRWLPAPVAKPSESTEIEGAS